jgi:DNA helicase-2/ATP-dependent DNA helicase PcrA
MPIEEESLLASTDADKSIARISKLRAKCIPEDRWREMDRFFWKQWQDWKDANDFMDFGDLIERAARDCPYAPGSPRTIFVDEAQDISAAEHNLLNQWAAQADNVVYVGDVDQALYTWRGADPDGVFDSTNLPDENVKVLCSRSPSYRVPSAIHASAMQWIRQRPDYVRIDYKPRDFSGSIQNLNIDLYYGKNRDDLNQKSFDVLIPHIEEDLSKGKKTMFIAACGYQLNWLIGRLRDSGVRYHNEYRPEAAQWNPVPKKDDGLTTSDRLADFLLNDDWTAEQARNWTNLLKAKGVFKHGALSKLKSMRDDQVMHFLHESITDADIAFRLLIDKDINVIKDYCKTGVEKSLFYLCAAHGREGNKIFEDEPKLTVGTIHSVKGGEADSVYLLTDISAKSERDKSREGSKSLYRQFYVGMTRAREKLTIINNDLSRSKVNLR